MNPLPNSNLQPINFQLQGSCLTQQVCGFSQANTSSRNSYIYPRNGQNVNIRSNAVTTSNLPFQNVGSSNILPKTSATSKNFVPLQNVQSMVTGSHSGVFSQLLPTVTQNTGSKRIVHTSPSVAFQGSNVYPMQNAHQKTLNLFITPDTSNQPVQNYSNSQRILAYQQPGNQSLSSSMPLQNVSYNAIGPGASHIGQSSLGAASSNHLNPQQKFSYIVFPSGQNIQNQASVRNPNVPVQSQQGVSNPVNPSQYVLPADCHNRNTAQVFPQTTGENSSVPYQTNYEQFVQVHPITKLQNYHSPMLDQSSNVYSPQYGQKNLSATDIQATDKGDRILYIVNGCKTDNLSNESAKSSVKVADDDLNLLQEAGPVHPIETSAPQMNRTLEQDKSLIVTKGNFPENLFKDKVMIKKGIVLDIQKLHKLRTELALLKEQYKVKLKMYRDANEKPAFNFSVQNQNFNRSPPPYNSHLNLPVTHETNQGFQVPSCDATQSKLFSSVSSDSSQIKDDYLLLQNADDHLLPILKSLLEGTTDKDLLLNAFIAKGDVQKSRLLATERDSSHTFLFSSGDLSEKNINNIDTSHSLTFKTPPVSSTKESLICTKSGLGLEMSCVSAKNQLEKISSVSSEGFDQNKSTAESYGQYLKNSLESSGQHAGASDECSLLLKELLQKDSASTHSSFSQQDKKTSPENLKEKVTGNSKDTSATSSSVSLFAKMLLSVQETDSMQQPSVAGNDCKIREVCTLEELETSLGLWRKSFPTLISGSTDSTGESSSSINDGAGGKKMQQSLETPSNLLGHNGQTQVTNETAQNCALPSLGKSLDTVNTSSLKGSDPQVAIVSPLILSKDNAGNYIRKNSPCKEITCPVIEESGVHDSQEIFSAVLDTDRGKKVCSPSCDKYCKDLDMSRKAVKFTEENSIVKTVTETNSSCSLDQVADDCSSLQQKHKKSQLVTGDRLPSEVYTGDLSLLPQNDGTYQSSSDLLGFGNTAEDTETGTLLQISSVCTLVQGDVSYDSQMANIFSTSPLKSSIKSDTSEEFMPLHCNDPHSDLSKSELGMNVSFPAEDVLLPSPNSLSRATAKILKNLPDLDMPQSYRTSDEKSEIELEIGKNTCPKRKKLAQNVSCSNVHCADVTSDQQILSENEKDQLGAIQKDSVSDHVLVGENQAHFESSVEIPLSSLSDQLAELSKEFPYGIGDLEALNVTEGDYSVTEIVEKEGKDNSEISGDIPDASDTKDEIKITILNPQEMKEVFSVHSSNKSENHQDDQLKMDSETNLRKENISCLKTEQGSDIGSKDAPTGTTVKSRKTTYCCLQGWMASFYSIQPCSCMLAKEAASKQKEDLVNASLSCKVESGLNSQLPAFTFLTFSESVPSGLEQNKTLPTAFTSKELKQHTASKEDKVILPPVLEKVHSQETERSKQQMMAESSTHATYLPLKTEIIEINEKCDKSASDCSSTEEAQHCSITGEIIMAPGRNLYKVDFGRQRNQRAIVKSKTETCLRRRLGKKPSVSYEQYRIKHDSSETHIIKGPVSKKHLKKQMAMKKKHKCLADQRGDVINASQLSSIGSVSEMHENSERNSILHSQEHLNHGWATYGPQHQIIQPLSKADGFMTVVNMPGAVVNPSTKNRDAVYSREEHQAGSLNCQRDHDLGPPNLESLTTPDINGKQLTKIKDFEKQFGYRKGENNRTTSSVHSIPESEHSIPESEHSKPEFEHSKPESVHSKPESEHRNHCIKMINLQKFAYSKERKNAWKYRNSDRMPLWQKQRGHMPNVSTKLSLGREDVLDALNRDVWSEKSFTDKKTGFRRTNSFQREQKKSYLNRLAFKRTAQKTIRLTTLESYSKPTLSGWQGDRNSSSSPTQDYETDKQILEFKMCPEILFRNPVSEEQNSDAKKLPEKDSTPVVAIKSKREDWLNYIPVKRRKTEDNETQADDAIPLATAIKLVNGDEAFPAPVKDSSATFLTYQKMHLEKTSQNMDASPIN